MIPKDSIPLFICCSCKYCDRKARYWYHASCGNKLYIDGNADIYCGGKEEDCLDPKTRCIINWTFWCKDIKAHKSQHSSFYSCRWSFALNNVITIASTIKELSEENQKILQKIYSTMAVRVIREAQMHVDEMEAIHAP